MNTVQSLLERGVHPSQICAVTFTRIAAHEIRRRMVQRFRQYTYEDFPWVGTIHSICVRLIGVPNSHIFYGKPAAEFTLMYPQYRFNSDMYYWETRDLELKETMLVTPGDWFEFFDSRRRNAMISFDDQIKHFVDSKAFFRVPLQWSRDTQQLYCQRKVDFLKEHDYFDFNALLETVIQRRLRPPDIQYLFADESQDNSPLLWAVLDLWAEGCERYVCLGDPDQCIYSDFLPADPDHFLRFIESARRLDLKQSHRLPRAIQAVSEEWISRNRQRVERTFLPRHDEGSVKGFCKIEDIDWPDLALNQGESRWKAFALARTRRQARRLKNWFDDRGIPYATNRGMANPLQTSIGRLSLAFIRLLEGDTVRADEMKDIERLVPAKPWLSHGAKTKFLRLAESDPSRRVDRAFLLQNGFTKHFIDSLTPEDFPSSLTIPDKQKSYLRRCYRHYGKEAFIVDPSILVTNIHGVKGMEADHVILDPVLKGLAGRNFFDHPEDERRVGYVAITRAREALYVLAPDFSQQYYDFKLETNGASASLGSSS